MNTIPQKKDIHQKLRALVDNKVQDYQEMVESLEESRNEDTKSSAGDKFETGREMMQREIDRVTDQLDQAVHNRKTLSMIDVDRHCTVGVIGALISSDGGVYYLSIAHGKLELNDQIIYAISVKSPLGILLLGRGVGEIVEINGRKIKITSIL